MPKGKLVSIGVWENRDFIGSILFGLGSGKSTLGKAHGLQLFQMAELVRVALYRHQTPVSRIVSIAVKMLRKQSPGIKLLVSFADPLQNHHGGIYQAMNWIYTGRSSDKF